MKSRRKESPSQCEGGRGMLFCGDPHGSFTQIDLAAKRYPDAPIILLGDIEPTKALPDELGELWERTWFIHGNHDTDDELVAHRVWSPAAMERSLHGRVVGLPGGTRVAGLGGVFRGDVWYPDPAGPRGGEPAWKDRESHASRAPARDRWRGGVPRKHWSSIYPREVDALSEQACDVLVLHEAPGYHPHGFELLDVLAGFMGARLVVHGHQHDALDSSARWAQQGFRSFGVGLRGVTWIDPCTGQSAVVVPGKLDAARAGRAMR